MDSAIFGTHMSQICTYAWTQSEGKGNTETVTARFILLAAGGRPNNGGYPGDQTVWSIFCSSSFAKIRRSDVFHGLLLPFHPSRSSAQLPSRSWWALHFVGWYLAFWRTSVLPVPPLPVEPYMDRFWEVPQGKEKGQREHIKWVMFCSRLGQTPNLERFKALTFKCSLTVHCNSDIFWRIVNNNHVIHLMTFMCEIARFLKFDSCSTSFCIFTMLGWFFFNVHACGPPFLAFFTNHIFLGLRSFTFQSFISMVCSWCLAYFIAFHEFDDILTYCKYWRALHWERPMQLPDVSSWGHFLAEGSSRQDPSGRCCLHCFGLSEKKKMMPA